MPFDLLPPEIDGDTGIDDRYLRLYRRRREQAADLWRPIPPEKFYLKTWDCGTTACAIGWLRRFELDRWQRVPTPWGFWVAATYFGIYLSDSDICFGNGTATEMLYQQPLHLITPAMVADKVLSLPYVIQPVILPGAKWQIYRRMEKAINTGAFK